MSSTTYVKPDSVLANTAREVLEAHAGGAGPRDGMMACPVCGQPLPCPTGRAAAEVLFAAGLAASSGLVDVVRGGLGPAAAESSFGAHVAPAPVPYPAAPAVPAPSPEPAPVAHAAPAVPAAGPEPGPKAAPSFAVPAAAPDPYLEAAPGTDAKAAPEAGVEDDVAPPYAAVPPLDAGAGGGWSTPAEQPPPAAEPELTEEIDPLLLGPPIHDRQNRPLDAPRFTPSARPPAVEEPAPASASWPAPAGPASVTPDQPAGSAAASWQTAGQQPGPISGITAGGVQTGAAPQGGLRPPLEPLQLGRHSTPEAPSPEVKQSVPVAQPPSPPVVHQTATAPLGRPTRPPLEPPQMGQLNRPLVAPPAPPAAPESGTPAEARSGLPGSLETSEPADAPSGLPVVSDADQSPAPSGLWGVSRNPGTPSGLPGVPSAPAEAWSAAPATADPASSGRTRRTGTSGGSSS